MSTATLTARRSMARRGLDIPLLASASLLMLVGLLSLYSEGYRNPDGTKVWRQATNLAIGLVPFAIFYRVNPSRWRKMAGFLYVANLGLLLMTWRMGESRGGAQRWLDIGPLQFQPSEVAKYVVIITLAAFLADREHWIRRPSTFLLSILHVAIPAGLIFLQPHLGATLVILAIWLCIALAARMPLRLVGGTILAAVLAVVMAFSVPGVMREYQRDRIRGLLWGQNDPQGKGYHTDRAGIAFGTGGFEGVGYLNGNQKQGGFIPEQHTDFIFTVIGEEGGLMGTSLVLGLFAFFFYRIWLVIVAARDPYHRMLAAGIYGLLVFHMVVNVGMLVGLLPVVGLWLPFLSYGGSALWLCMSCVGLLLAIRRRERPLVL